jgi:hypothetical protein
MLHHGMNQATTTELSRDKNKWEIGRIMGKYIHNGLGSIPV